MINPPRRAEIDAELTGELLAEADHELVGPRLMQIGIEQQRRIHAAGGRRRHSLSDAVLVGVHVGCRQAAGVAETHDVVASVHLLVQA